jgi:hypothetical protein
MLPATSEGVAWSVAQLLYLIDLARGEKVPDKPKDIYDLYKQSRAYNALGFFADPTSQQQMASGLTNALSRG